MTTFADTCVRPDSLTTPNPASDGGLWTVISGTWGISGNKAYAALGGSFNPAIMEREDVDSSTVDVSVDITLPSGSADSAYIWIATGGGGPFPSGYVLRLDGTTTAQVFWGGVNPLFTAPVAGRGTGQHTYRFVHDGSGHVSLLQDGGLVGSGTDPGFPSSLGGTVVSLATDLSSIHGTTRFTNFTAVTPVPPPPPPPLAAVPDTAFVAEVRTEARLMPGIRMDGG